MAERRTKVVLNIAGWDELRKSPEVEKLVADTAQGVADRAGEDFLVAVHQRKKQVVANVYPSTAKAMAREAKHGLLSKAVGGGG